MAAQLPDKEFISGDGLTLIYRFKERDYTTGYTVASQVRPTRYTRTTTKLPLATPSIARTYVPAAGEVEAYTQITLTFTGTQTRAIGNKGYLDIQVTQSGGQPLTLIQQKLLAQGDVTQ